MKDFIKRDVLTRLAVGGLTVALVAGTACRTYSDNKALEQMNQEIKCIHQEIKVENDRNKDTKKKLDTVEDKLKGVDQIQKHLDEVDKAVKEKLSYRERMSVAIQQTSSYVDKHKADELAGTIDEVTTEFKGKYDFPKDDAKVMAIMSTESDFRNLEPNDAGAIGYTQITPPCLDEVNKLTGWDLTMDDMYNAKKNLQVAWFYINRDRAKYGDDKSIVAYNQGYRNLEGAVQVSRGSSGSYLSKVTNRTLKYSEMIGGASK